MKSIVIICAMLVMAVSAAFAADTLDGKVYQVPTESITCDFAFHVTPFGPNENGTVSLICDGKNYGKMDYTFINSSQSGFIANQFPFWIDGDQISIAIQFLEGKEK